MSVGGGYAQSNHARMCSAAAPGGRPAAAGRGPPAGATASGADRVRGGNALLTRLLCDDIRVVAELATAPTDRLAEVEARRRVFAAIADELVVAGHKPYVIYGTSVALGVMGYVAAAVELQDSSNSSGSLPTG